jgi:hypothetical protein
MQVEGNAPGIGVVHVVLLLWLDVVIVVLLSANVSGDAKYVSGQHLRI